MAELTAERKMTAKLAVRHLMEPKTRRHLKEHGITPQAPIVACEWETPVSEVLGMLRRQDGSQHVVILIRRELEILILFATTGDAPQGSASVSEPEMHGRSTIGMVYDSLNPSPITVVDVHLRPTKRSRIGQYDLVPA